MALHLHRAERTDLLADGLGALLSDPLDDPFAEEVVIVPAKGVERWLSQRLSHILGRGNGQDGVCAGVSFRNPRSLIAEITGTEDDDPWHPDALVWPLLEVIDQSCDDEWCQTLATHLGHFEAGEEKELRRAGAIRWRDGWPASSRRTRANGPSSWSTGKAISPATSQLTFSGSHPCGARFWTASTPTHLTFGTPKPLPHCRSPPPTCPSDSPCSATPGCPAPKSNCSTRCRPITTFTCGCRTPATASGNPSPTSTASSPAATTPATARSDIRCWPPSAATSANSNAACRRTRRPTNTSAAATGPTRFWAGCSPTSPPTRCGAKAERCAPATARCRCTAATAPPAKSMFSVRFCSACSPTTTTLEPRDILVMCPDIETYAPLIVAGFGLGDMIKGVHPAHKLRVRLADRSLVQTNPLLGVASQLLALAGGRATSSEVLNLAQAAPVRARFGFTDDNLEDITRWVRQANIRWGFDREHRQPYGVDFIQNTWRFGIDRVLAGVAMSDDSHAWIDTTLPLDDVSSNRVELAGQLAEYVDRLQHVVESLTGARPLRRMADRTRGRHQPAGPRRRRRCLADQPAAARVRRRAHQRGPAGGNDDAPARCPRPTGPPPRRTADPRQLPHRHADGLHDGADALGAAPGGLPRRPRRRRLPAARRRRR